MNASHHVEPIRKLSRRPCACCGTYRSFGFEAHGRWIDMPPHRDAVCFACRRKFAFALDLERRAARVERRCIEADFDLAAK